MLGKIGQIMQNFSGFMKKEEAETDASAGSLGHSQAQIGQAVSDATNEVGFDENVSDISIEHVDQNILNEVGARGMTGDKRIYTDENFDLTSAVEMVHICLLYTSPSPRDS